MLTLMSASGKLSMIALRTARAPCTHSGHVGDSKARKRSLSLSLLKSSFKGCNELARETTSTDDAPGLLMFPGICFYTSATLVSLGHPRPTFARLPKPQGRCFLKYSMGLMPPPSLSLTPYPAKPDSMPPRRKRLDDLYEQDIESQVFPSQRMVGI